MPTAFNREKVRDFNWARTDLRLAFFLQRASVPGQAVGFGSGQVFALPCVGGGWGRRLRPPLGNTAGTTCIHPQPELTHVQTSLNPGHLGL